MARPKAQTPAAGSANGRVGREQAEFAVAHFAELLPDLRGCAVLDSAGKLLAASGENGGWESAAADLLAAADAAAGAPAEHVHVGTEDGEAFAVRHDGLAMVAVTERFTLSSLVVFDMRAILRDLSGDGAVTDRRAGAAAGNEVSGSEV